MSEELKNCWEIMKCGREAGGMNVSSLGECIASKTKMGHSCWAIAGTLCGGEVRGSVAEKEENCLTCKLYKMYGRPSGSKAREVVAQFPDEDRRHNENLHSPR